MRIISFNANGLRSAASKGFFEWFATQDADVLCIQETKAQEHQLVGPEFLPAGYKAWFRDASTKKGYSGVAIYAKREPDEVRTALGWPEFDEEGRYIEARFGNLSVVSFYIPSGSSGELRQGYKFQVMEWLRPILSEWLASGRQYVLCGDWNIVRSALDIKNWKSNQKNSGSPAAGAGLAQRSVRRPAGRGRCQQRARLGGQLPRAASAGRGLHLVEQPRRCPRQQRGMAHRLPTGHPRAARQGAGLFHLPRAALFRPRPLHRGLRAVSQWRPWRGAASRGGYRSSGIAGLRWIARTAAPRRRGG